MLKIVSYEFKFPYKAQLSPPEVWLTILSCIKLSVGLLSCCTEAAWRGSLESMRLFFFPCSIWRTQTTRSRRDNALSSSSLSGSGGFQTLWKKLKRQFCKANGDEIYYSGLVSNTKQYSFNIFFPEIRLQIAGAFSLWRGYFENSSKSKQTKADWGPNLQIDTDTIEGKIREG